MLDKAPVSRPVALPKRAVLDASSCDGDNSVMIRVSWECKQSSFEELNIIAAWPG
jgi:hypothetical protein